MRLTNYRSTMAKEGANLTAIFGHNGLHCRLCWLLIFLTFCLNTTILCVSEFHHHNTPPVLDLKREWIIPEDEIVGSKILMVRARDAEGDAITYELEPALFQDGSNFFSINSKSGQVFLKQSVMGKAGNKYYLLVAADDGQLTSKIEVFIRVVAHHDGNSDHLEYPSKFFNGPLLNERWMHNIHPLPPGLEETPKKKILIDKELPKKTNLQPTTILPLDDETLWSKKIEDFTSSSRSLSELPTPIDVTKSKEVDEEELRRDEKEKDIFMDRDEISHPQDTRSTVKKSFYPLDDGKRVTPQLLADLLPIFSAITLLLFALLIIFSAQKICSKRAQRPSIKSWPWNESAPKNGCNMDTSLCSVASDSDYNQTLFYNSKRIDRVDFHSPHNISFMSTLPSKAVMISNPADSVWEFPRHRLRILGILGEGCFGKVWRCEAFNISGKEGPTIVAVKTIKEGATERDRQDLKCELEIMKLLEPHSNVVSLLGCCTEIEPNFLILEYAPFGTLQSYLRDGRTERLYDNVLGAFSSKDLTSFGFQVAKGMEYISSKGIIHRDLAARNVLMSTNKTCKISDFGFSRKVPGDQIYQHKTEGRLPIRWMSPEALYENKFSSKSDIWSFGILMWEIVTLGSTPYLGLSTKEVMKKVKEGYRPEKPDHCKREFYNIMFYCWHENPDERPMFSELAKMLENLISSENEYIELDRFPDHCYYNVLTNMSGEKL